MLSSALMTFCGSNFHRFFFFVCFVLNWPFPNLKQSNQRKHFPHMQHKINFPMVAVEKQTHKVFSFNLQCKTRHLFRVVSDHRKDSPQLGLLQTNLGNQNSPHGWVTSFLGNDRPDTFVSAAWWFPCKRGDGSFPHLEVSCSWRTQPQYRAHSCICSPDVQVHQERMKKKRESAEWV